jgi:hypothetical protein
MCIWLLSPPALLVTAPNFSTLLDFPKHDTFFFGDLNAHHSSWFSPRDPSDPPGDRLASFIEPSDLCILNSDSLTRLPFGNTPPSSPDTSRAPSHLLTSFSWSVLTSLDSDHLPIIVSYLSDFQPPRLCRSFTNFKLANWPGFIILRDVLNTASKHNIPSGYRKDFIPGLQTSVILLISERDEIRARDPSDPAIPVLNARIDDSIRSTSRQTWRDKVECSSLKKNPAKCWSLLEKLSGKSSRLPPNQPISFKGKASTHVPEIARYFCNQFTKTVPHKSNR